ncbi:glycoside hydrolase, family 13 [Kipferlia bialata]|uniref:Glycoside hydrolase, family 13 n=1 Tax=Kipferlia bialata TaxID=797122 RepID=A0A9K3D1Y6_9EUKA|nr:glycoside hydrolase, family 13 [Kipferlia bialata]|eukprot:g9224.t1
MFDVVANHTGNCSSDPWDFSCLTEFNKEEYFHTTGQDQHCDINWSDYSTIEPCWLSGLPDLDQDNGYVKQQLLNWIRSTVNTYDVDGVRYDTVMEVPSDFWQQFTRQARTFTTGECYDGNMSKCEGYQRAGAMDSLIDYPTYWNLQGVFGSANSLWSLSSHISEQKSTYKDPSILTVFLDNHDNQRWLHMYGDYPRYFNALGYLLTSDNIPVVYYGTEAGFSGGNDPYCREALWDAGFTTSNPLYSHLQTLNSIRGVNNNDWLNTEQVEMWVKDDLYCYTRGDMLVALTNAGDNTGLREWPVSNLPFNGGERICNLFWPDNDCITVPSDGTMDMEHYNGEMKIWVRATEVDAYLGR